MDLKNEFQTAIDNMTIEDLPNEDLKDVARVCGIKTAIILLENLGGINIYIPNKDGLKKVTERFVIEHFDGKNAKKLAMACGISTTHIYEIVRKEDNKRNAHFEKHEQQQNLFTASL